MLGRNRIAVMEGWAARQFATGNAEETLQLNSHALGTVETLTDLIGMTYEEFKYGGRDGTNE